MSTFQVDSDRVLAAAGIAATTAGNLGGQVDALMRQLNALGDCWQGSAAANFQQLAHEWEGVQKQVHGSLERIQAALQQAGRQYAEVELATARMFTG
ncbi:WXG100 family type VII secretion target [Brevibacterium sp. 50QC2O2]|uniref:WXG100 family type VII secretion target n=1 Tax=Brevibacterium TaxID=1696 RepID=UPI00211BD088|nr:MULTISPECIES: WXG100 family type VII secretion target [unclassified Brevibacterium]MCQ9385061.1 WXG100 family type VII secretion target [Brevibacterium sp. 68QC2CO]MCQ9387759.1 WXG100 family type VII secretion target [Brevibacterium sp. 50QC2O2]